MRTLLLASLLAVVAVGCGANPDDCFKGNDEACHSLCETGKEEYVPLCYMPRARKALACAEKGTDCESACKEWEGPGGDETRRGYFVGNIGDTAKVAAIDARCAKAAPATP